MTRSRRFYSLAMTVLAVVLAMGASALPVGAVSKLSHTDGLAQEGTIVADLGFRAKDNGFAFQNYTNDSIKDNLTAADVRRLFGDEVCASLQGDTCILTPPGQQWMDSANKGMNGGHCEGMAALSLIFYAQKEAPTDFGGPQVTALQLQDNDKLQREIAYWFITQATSPAANSVIADKTPNELIDILTAAMKDGPKSTDTYTFGIFKPGFKEGHAITPYAVVDRGNDITWVMVYDNNFPGEERHVEIDRKANKWNYSAAADPTQPESLYEGNADTKTLMLSPTAPRLTKQVCPFCAASTSSKVVGRAEAAQQYNEIWLEGDASLLITDDQGHKLGYEGDNFVNEIPGAKADHLMSADLWKDDPEPVYYVPVGIKFTILLDGTDLKAPGLSDVSMIGAGYDLAVEDIKLTPGQKDTMTFSPDGTQLSYKSSQTEAPNIVVGLQHSGADYEFDTKGVEIDAGGTINMDLNFDKGQLAIHTTDTKTPAAYELIVNRIDDKGEQSFSNDGVTLAPSDTAYIDFAAWKGNGTPMNVGIDKGSVGTIAETIPLTDQK